MDKRQTYLGFRQDQVNEQDDKVVFDIFVRESFAPGTLCEPDALSQRAVIGLGVGGV